MATQPPRSTAPLERIPRTAGEERERVRQALHDGLGQLLTSICFLAGSLRQKLEAQDLPEAKQAAEIVALTSEAVSEAQALIHNAPQLEPVPETD